MCILAPPLVARAVHEYLALENPIQHQIHPEGLPYSITRHSRPIYISIYNARHIIQ